MHFYGAQIQLFETQVVDYKLFLEVAVHFVQKGGVDEDKNGGDGDGDKDPAAADPTGEWLIIICTLE